MLIELGIPLLLFIIGFVIGRKVFHTSGVLSITEDDDEKDKWFFTITDPIDDIYKRKTIKIKIERGTVDGRGN